MKRKILAMFLAFTMIFGSIGTVFAEEKSDEYYEKEFTSFVKGNFNNELYYKNKGVLNEETREAYLFIAKDRNELLKDIGLGSFSWNLVERSHSITSFKIGSQDKVILEDVFKKYSNDAKDWKAKQQELHEIIIAQVCKELSVDSNTVKINELIGKSFDITFGSKKDALVFNNQKNAPNDPLEFKFKVYFKDTSYIQKCEVIFREIKDGKVVFKGSYGEFNAVKENAETILKEAIEKYANNNLKGYVKVKEEIKDENGKKVAYYDFKEKDAPSGMIKVTWRFPDEYFMNAVFDKSFEKDAKYYIKDNIGGLFSMTFLYPKGTSVENITIPENKDMDGASGNAFNGWEPEVKGILNKDTVYTADIVYKGADPVKPNAEAKVDGSVEITLPRKNGSVRTIHVTYIPEGSKQAVKVEVTRDDMDLKWKTTNKDIKVDEKTGKIIIPGDKVADETEVIAMTENYERKKSEAVKVKSKIPTKPEGDRVKGKDRIETAIEISKDYFGSADTVIVVDASNFPDAMTASVLAKQYKAPILLTNPKKLDSKVKAEIERLGASDVIIVGGNSSVSEAVKNELKQFDDDGVDRIYGKDRYETSAKVAKKVVEKTGKLEHAVIASGEVFADALTVGPYAAREGYPILLVKKNVLPKSVSDAITELDIKQVTIAGGTGSVSKELESSLPTVAERLSGKNRYETAMDIAVRGIKKSDEIFVANGEKWMDALVIGPVGGMLNMPILLTGVDNAPQSLKDYIAKAKVQKLTAVGGNSMISESLLQELTK